MDIHVKERLTGAVILVLAVVLVVPELLHGPRGAPPPSASPVATDGAPVRSYRVDLTGRNGGLEQLSSSEGAAEGAASPAESTTAAPSPSPAAPAASMARAPVAVPSSTAPSKLVTTAPATGSPAIAPAAVSPHVSRPAPAVPATAGSADAAAAQPSGPWSIQVGSFSSRENADRLAKQLEAKGFKTYVSRTGTGAKQMYRVRVGPVSSRAAVDALAQKLRAAGRAGTLVPPGA